MKEPRSTIILTAFMVMTVVSGAVGQTNSEPAQNPQEPATSAPASEAKPSAPPVVTFRDGQLTITAVNSTMRQVLEMVRTETGAIIDIPSTANERVFVQLGPGPARAILNSLLQGSDFNYAIVSPESDPTAVATVALFVKAPPSAERTSLPESAHVSSDAPTDAEETSYQVIQGPPPIPIKDTPAVTEALSKLASSVVRRASSHL